MALATRSGFTAALLHTACVIASVSAAFTQDDTTFEAFLSSPKLSTAQFFDTVWEKDYAHIQRGNASFYTGLVSSADIDFAVRNSELYYNKHLKLIKSGEIQMFSEEPAKMEDVYKAFGEGVSVAMNQFHQRIPAIAALVHDLEQCLATWVNANLYLTPMGIEGKKRWKIWPPYWTLPGHRMEVTDEVLAQLTPFELTMEPGDMLYLPRGWIHAPFTFDDSHSMHVTLGVEPSRWDEVLVSSLKALASTEAKSPAASSKSGKGSKRKSRRNKGASKASGGSDSSTSWLDTLPKSNPPTNWVDVVSTLVYSFSQQYEPLREGFPLRALGLSAATSHSPAKAAVQDGFDARLEAFVEWTTNVYIEDMFPMFGWSSPPAGVTVDSLQTTMRERLSTFQRSASFNDVLHSLAEAFARAHVPATGGHLKDATYAAAVPDSRLDQATLRRTGVIGLVLSSETVPAAHAGPYAGKMVVVTNGEEVTAHSAALPSMLAVDRMGMRAELSVSSLPGMSACGGGGGGGDVCGHVRELLRGLLRSGYLTAVS